MYFQLPEHVASLQKQARSFFESEIRPIADVRDSQGPLSREELRDLIQHLRPIGWVTAAIPRRFGGAERSVLERVVLGEEVARVWPALGTTIDTHMGIAAAVCLQGPDWMREKYLTRAIEGDVIFCDMVSEPQAGTDTRALRTRATLQGEHYVVNGEKMWITNGPWADVGLLSAVSDAAAYEKDSKQGLVRLLVEKPAAGWNVRDLPLLGLRAGTTGHFVFENLMVPKSNVFGDESKGYSDTLKTRGWARVSLAGKAVGIMQAALDDAVCFAKELSLIHI